MKLIPAIDLKQGFVVHAHGGLREDYLPVRTEHFPDARPLNLIARLMEVCETDTVYLADLDAIQERGDNRMVVEQIRRRFPALRVWLDYGIRHHAGLITKDGTTVVVGTETLRDDISHFKQDDYILSLDFKDGELLSDADGGGRGSDIFARHDEWPSTVIALSLTAVGSGRGPDLQALRQLRKCYKGKLIAGGGIRDGDDMRALGEIGVDGALAATAIYNGTLP